MTSAERTIVESTQSILAPWIRLEREHARQWIRSYSEVWHSFAVWCDDFGVDAFAGAMIVAAYLLELAADGASLDELDHAAGAIDFYYRKARICLDREPINAALAIIEAQTRPDRVLN